MCKKHCKYREKIAFGAIYNHFFNPNGRVTLLRFIWGVFWAYPASCQGQVGGFVWQFTILLGLYWATSGLCSALQHIRSVGGLKLGLSWLKWPYWVISRLCWAYLGSCAGVLGHLEGYVEILEGYKAICG